MNIIHKISPIFHKVYEKMTVEIASKKDIDKHTVLNDTTFLSKSYIDIIVKHFNKLQEYTFIHNNNKIIIYLYTTDYKDLDVWNLDDDYILILHVAQMFSIIEYLQMKHVKIPIHFYPTPFLKEWDGHNLTPNVVNSGFTINGINDKHIVIYRKEEYNRLLFHEMIHFLLLDSAMDINVWKDAHLHIINDFRIMKHINLFEAYTDTWAILWCIIMKCVLLPECDYNKMIEEERKHIKCMVRQLLYETDIDNINMIRKTPWKQETSALTYYVFKYATLNMENFTKKYKFPMRWTRKKALMFYNDIISYLQKNDINKKYCSKSAKLSYIGYDV
jgi:hypothetical protein